MKKYSGLGVDTFVSHGKKTAASEHQTDQIVSWFGSELNRNTRISFLDIALVSRNSRKTLILAEIGEPATPRYLMSDALAALHESFILPLRVSKKFAELFWR